MLLGASGWWPDWKLRVRQLEPEPEPADPRRQFLEKYSKKAIQSQTDCGQKSTCEEVGSHNLTTALVDTL